MNPRLLRHLLGVTALSFFIPYLGKDVLPAVFGSAFVQWGSSVITSVLLSLGFVCSAYRFFTFRGDRKGVAWTLLGFTGLFTLILMMLCFYNGLGLLALESVDGIASMGRSTPPPELTEQRALLLHTLKQIPYIVALYVVTFSLGWIIGILSLTYRTVEASRQPHHELDRSADAVS
jgi:hypothetical protein